MAGGTGGHCGAPVLWGAAKTWHPPAVEAGSPEQSKWPLLWGSLCLAGAGEDRWCEQGGGHCLARRGGGTGLCGVWGLRGQPSCLSGAGVSNCQVQRKQHGFPCGWVGEAAGTVLGILWETWGVVSLEGEAQIQFSTSVLLSQGRCTVGGERTQCCGPSVLLKAPFPPVCGVSKGWLRGAAKAESFLPTAEVGAFGQSSVWPLGTAGNSVCHFWTWLLVHGALCKIKSRSLCRCYCGTWQSYVSAAAVLGGLRVSSNVVWLGSGLLVSGFWGFAS